MDYYSQNAQALVQQYNQLPPEQVHTAWLKYLPTTAGKALDIGAGSGRDALWLANQDWSVTAVEPCDALRTAMPQHKNIQVINDQLPALSKTPKQPYDLILLSAVWMHLTQPQQQTALNQLQTRLAPSATLIITWRNQGNETLRRFESVDESILHTMSTARLIEIIKTEDKGGRQGIEWTCAVIKGHSGINQ